ncbi:MAG: NADH-quinone oxidoreductase subunit C [Crocinitomicaceae bacterium]
MQSSTLTNEQVYTKLKEVFGDSIITNEEPFGILTLEVANHELHNMISWLNKDKEFSINFLTLLGAVHYPEEKGREIAIVYHLHSLVNNFRIRLKVYLPIDNASVKTITDIYLGANWMERETFDFYGVKFEGHPNLTRILNADEVDYHPMLKQYRLEDATREDKDDKFFGR